MNGIPDLPKTTKLLADQSRLNILTMLMDGKFHTVHELAKTTRIKDHTASYHLKKLLTADWVTSYKRGRYVYYQLSNPAVAELLESLTSLSPVKEIHSFNENKLYQELTFGRTCYCHLAGRLGVQFFDYLLDSNYLVLENNQIELTKKGSIFFDSLAIDTVTIKKQPGTFAKPCLDWSERNFHLAGNLGKAFLIMCREKELIVQNSSNRGVTLTDPGKAFFDKYVPKSTKES